MTEKYKPRAGDRVRVVLEGEVKDVSGLGFAIGGLDGNYIVSAAEHVISIEKIEPAVETFSPGQIVRSKLNGHILMVAKGGYVSALRGRYVEDDYPFTSEEYELVTL